MPMIWSHVFVFFSEHVGERGCSKTPACPPWSAEAEGGVDIRDTERHIDAFSIYCIDKYQTKLHQHPSLPFAACKNSNDFVMMVYRAHYRGFAMLEGKNGFLSLELAANLYVQECSRIVYLSFVWQPSEFILAIDRKSFPMPRDTSKLLHHNFCHLSQRDTVLAMPAS